MPQNDQIWPKIGIFSQFGPGPAGLFNALLWVGWWLWRAGCISQDTYLLYDFLKTVYAFLRIGYLYVYPQCHLARETKAIVGTWAVIRVTGVGLLTLASKASLVNISKPDCALNMSVNLCDYVLIEISSLSRHKNVM